MSDPIFDVHPDGPRWTHVALRVDDVDDTIAWYEEMTPLVLIDRREDHAGKGAWLGMPDQAEHPFILVVAEFNAETDPFAGAPKEVLAPFSHIGIELPTREAVDEMAARGERNGCLAMPATLLPPPIGYICMLRDPTGNMVEFSWDQGVWATVRDRLG